MFVKAVLLGLVGVFCVLDSRLLGRLNFERPLIVSTLVGIVLGDVTQGLTIGASLELMALGLVNIGAAAPPDMNMAAIIATAFSILSHANTETALTIAVPISVLGQLLGVLMRTILSNLTHVADDMISRANFTGALHMHIVWGTVLYSLMYFVPIFLAVYFGTDLVRDIVTMVPKWLTTGLGVAAKILPAFGFALLLQTMLTKKMLPFLLLGFLITAYSGLGVTGVALFACLVAFFMADVKFSTAAVSAGNEADPLDDDL